MKILVDQLFLYKHSQFGIGNDGECKDPYVFFFKKKHLFIDTLYFI